MIKRLFVFLLLCIASTASMLSFANTALWEVSNGPYKIWLGASLPALKKPTKPMPAEFDDAFRRADILYVERDITAVNQPDFGVRAMQASIYRDGRNLKSVLTPANWQALEKFAQPRGVPAFSLLLFKPAFAGFTLTTLEAKRLQLGKGVDAHYYYRARNIQKPVATLETIDQQIQFLQKINDTDANVLIETMLNELSDLSSTLDQATQSWRAGDMQKLDQLKGKKMRAQAPELYRELVVNRSKAWLPQFKTMLNNADVEYVLVDSAHLTGPDNLLQLLKAEGFTVKPYSL
jgi:hypothetical protein